MVAYLLGAFFIMRVLDEFLFKGLPSLLNGSSWCGIWSSHSRSDRSSDGTDLGFLCDWPFLNRNLTK
jgi:hypothetical protein